MTKMMASSSGREVRGYDIVTKEREKRPPVDRNCDNCGTCVTGKIYYHCTKCKDHDLCDTCERRNDQLIAEGNTPIHDPAHVSLKYR